MRRLAPASLLLALSLGATAGMATAAERITIWPAKPQPVVGEVVPTGDQEPPLPPPPKEPRPLPQPGPGYYPRTPHQARELPPGYPPVNNDHSEAPVRDWWRFGRPLGCWATFNGYGCSSLGSTLSFIMGSCRTFYGEPCLKGAPPSPMPPWAGPESGYRGDKGLPGENGRESLPLGYHLRKIAGGCPSCQ